MPTVVEEDTVQVLCLLPTKKIISSAEKNKITGILTDEINRSVEMIVEPSVPH